MFKRLLCFFVLSCVKMPPKKKPATKKKPSAKKPSRKPMEVRVTQVLKLCPTGSDRQTARICGTKKVIRLTAKKAVGGKKPRAKISRVKMEKLQKAGVTNVIARKPRSRKTTKRRSKTTKSKSRK